MVTRAKVRVEIIPLRDRLKDQEVSLTSRTGISPLTFSIDGGDFGTPRFVPAVEDATYDVAWFGKGAIGDQICIKGVLEDQQDEICALIGNDPGTGTISYRWVPYVRLNSLSASDAQMSATYLGTYSHLEGTEDYTYTYANSPETQTATVEPQIFPEDVFDTIGTWIELRRAVGTSTFGFSCDWVKEMTEIDGAPLLSSRLSYLVDTAFGNLAIGTFRPVGDQFNGGAYTSRRYIATQTRPDGTFSADSLPPTLSANLSEVGGNISSSSILRQQRFRLPNPDGTFTLSGLFYSVSQTASLSFNLDVRLEPDQL